ncbi:MAG: adenylate/guanylate cyclase domain-containing protein [Saprospiraceae bacterium]
MSQSRQLAAIMFTDIVGYTALMGQSENSAFDILRKNRLLQKPVIDKFNGRWIKELGDGVMASFNTVSDAVNAALQIQMDCNTANEFQLRIGIHLGEVVFEDNDVFGDGVNIASRIQSIAKPGSIYISESVRHNVLNKKMVQTRFIGEETLKNVKDPVRIYEALAIGQVFEAIESIAIERRPNSIAVLPFANMSSDPEQEYFSDGLTDEIITDLSNVKLLLVISRSSSMTLKGTQKKMKDIAAEMSVQYVLEGSVRKAGNNLRITAQLIDAVNDVQLWAEKYSGTLEDVFEMQEQVSRSIVDALKLKLTPEEVDMIAERPIANIHAYDCYLKARHEIFRGTKDSFQKAFKLLQNGLDLIGPNDLLFGLLGFGYTFYYRFLDKSDSSYLIKAKECAVKAFELNPRSVLGHVVEGWLHWAQGNIQESANSMRQALEIEPSNYDALFGLAEVYLYAGQSEDSYDLGQKLSEIDPLNPMSHIMHGSFFMDTNIMDCLPYFEKAYQMDPLSPLTQWMLASGYFWCGMNEEGYRIVDILEQSAQGWSFTNQILFLKYGLQGNEEKALQYATKELEDQARDDRHFAFHLAECYAAIGEKDKALDLLEYSMVLFFPYRFLSSDLLFANIRNEKRFQDLMADAKERVEAFEI